MNAALVDGAPLLPAVIFDEMVGQWPQLAAMDELLPDLMELPDPWQWDWETPLRAQLRVLSGSPDVTGWTTEHAAVLNEVMESPEAPTLLSLSDDVTQVLPASGLGADGGTTDE